MSDEMQIEGQSYISSKRAAELSGYAQDYIGQLARKGLIEARRIGGLWYILMPSLEEYKKKADEYKPQPPTRLQTGPEPSSLVFFDGKEYVSAAHAAELTGYAQDYVGQLARSGTILSRQVGNRWYVEKESITTHKREKDALLAAVQAQSVGLIRQTKPAANSPEYLANIRDFGSQPVFTYTHDTGDLMPATGKVLEHEAKPSVKEPTPTEDMRIPVVPQPIPIKRVLSRSVSPDRMTTRGPQSPVRILIEQERRTAPLLIGAAATIVIVISAGYASVLKQDSAYAVNPNATTQMQSLSASVDEAFGKIGDVLEPILSRQLIYTRQGTN